MKDYSVFHIAICNIHITVFLEWLIIGEGLKYQVGWRVLLNSRFWIYKYYFLHVFLKEGVCELRKEFCTMTDNESVDCFILFSTISSVVPHPHS